ncbi:MAG: diacylglycerol kinase family protein [Bacteroidales bacterium]|nr:hypothetical protein [Lentimicrobiaceae bacterium]MDD5695167.1 diacylglycerol kinase family protein [Bacteroidales bacterium]
MKIAILVNYSANHNRAEKRWNKIKEDILREIPVDCIVMEFHPPFDTEECIRILIQEHGIEGVISAGGDGSVNRVLNAIMNLKHSGLPKIQLGAIGLGSSNDFLKPVTTRVGGFPVRINVNQSSFADVGQVSFIKTDGQSSSLYFVVNASLGVTAEANLLFNKGDYFLNNMKSLSVKTAILYAALRTIIRFRNKSIQVLYDRVEKTFNMTNVSVVKNPNISGNFRYDQKILPDDGYLGLNYCHDMNKIELLRTLMDLFKGRFSGKRKRVSALVRQVKVDSPNFLALEVDGEVLLAKNIEFSILPGAIRLAGN